MYVLFIILHVMVSIVLTIAVLLQSSKGGGLAGAFGGSGAPQQILGSRGMTTLLHKITIWCGIGFMVTSLSLFMMSGSRARTSSSVLESAHERGAMAPAVPVPLTEELPATPVPQPAPAADAPAGQGADRPQGGQ